MEKRQLCTIRMPKAFWEFLREQANKEQLPINRLVIELIKKYKKRVEKELTDDSNLLS